MPWRTSRDSVEPNAVVNRNAPINSAIAAFSSLVHTLTLIRAWARSNADCWVKCTTYTGDCLVSSSSAIVSCIGVVAYE